MIHGKRQWVAGWLATVTSVTFLAGPRVLGTGAFEYAEGPDWIRITGHTDPTGELVVPETIAGKPVTTIDYQAFRDCTALTAIHLPATLTTISHAAFQGCLNLETVTLPDGVTTFGNNAFFSCPKLHEFDLPAALTSLGTNALQGCASLERVRVPAGITAVPWGTFLGCRALREVELPATLSHIGDSAFKGCEALAGIDLPPGLTTMDRYAFEDCATLGEIVLPEGLGSLGIRVFNGCRSLTSVTVPTGLAAIPDGTFQDCEGLVGLCLPESVTTVGASAVRRCDSLERVIFLGDAPVVGSSAFAEASVDFHVYFFDGAEGFTTPTWNGYPTINMGIETATVRWLTQHDQAPGAALDEDLNGDGVSLLVAYALGLDPRRNLAGSLPRAVCADGEMSLSFPGTAEGIDYAVQTTTGLDGWAPVTVGAPDGDGMRTAKVPMDVPRRFLRLVVIRP